MTRPPVPRARIPPVGFARCTTSSRQPDRLPAARRQRPLAIEYDPADAVRALAEAERLGRESLAEARSTVGLLRQDGDSGVAPLPGAAFCAKPSALT